MARAKKGSGCFCGRETQRATGKIRVGVGTPPPLISAVYLEVADLKDGLRVRKVVLLQVCIESGGWGAEVGDSCG